MACADVDMDIHDEDDRYRGGQREQPVVRYYQASEMIPDKKGPLHDLMQKHPAVLGVRGLKQQSLWSVNLSDVPQSVCTLMVANTRKRRKYNNTNYFLNKDVSSH